MIDRDAVNGALRTVRFEGAEEEYPAMAALVRWADEARGLLELLADMSHDSCMPHVTEKANALLAEWPKEADRG